MKTIGEMMIFELLGVFFVGVVVGSSLRHLYVEIAPYVRFYLFSSNLANYAPTTPKPEIVVSIGYEYCRLPLRKRFAMERSRGLN
jgi:hypothetical protein